MEADSIKVEMAEMQGVQENTVSLMTNVVIYIPYIIDAFYDKYPNYTVRVTSTHSKRIEKAIHTGRVDFALCAKPLDEDMNINLKTEIVHHEVSMIMLPPEHPLRKRSGISIRDFHREPLIISPVGFGMRDTIDDVLSRHGVQPRIIVETGEVADIIRFVRKGIGCAFMPKSIVEKVPALYVDCFELADVKKAKPIGLSFRDLPYRSIANRDFCEFVKTFFKEQFYTDEHLNFP
jgi:DNA-binding transcriptional LysR family regulator